MLLFGIIAFVLLVVIHEAGHFVAARRNGVDVEEFGIGFPPKIVGKTMGRGKYRTLYTLNWLPLGGFVKLKGENDADKRPGAFGAATLWQKTKITMAGIAMNFVAAAVIFTVLAFTGIPEFAENQFSLPDSATNVRSEVRVGVVDEGSPAADAGIQIGDTIVSVNGQAPTDAANLFDVTSANAGSDAEVQINRGTEPLTLTIPLNAEDATIENSEGEMVPAPILGVGPIDIVQDRYTWMAPVIGIGVTAQLSWLTLTGLFDIVTSIFTGGFGDAAATVSGPVGIVSILGDIGSFGMGYMMFFIALISLTLGVMNTLPIPALDGGRLFVTAIFTWLKKPLKPEVENAIHGTGFALLMLLILVITLSDLNVL